MFKINITESENLVNEISEIINNVENMFNKRNCGLQLKTFIIVFTVYLCFMKTVTLEGIANNCQKIQKGLSLTKQGLHKRLAIGKKPLEDVLSKAVESKLQEPLQANVAMVLTQFRSVVVADSTTISLPDKLEHEHKGLGGTNAKSALKIQASYDIKSKNFKKIEIIDNATKSDGSYVPELVKELKKNDLLIADLGFYGVVGFKDIEAREAYFISKVKSNTNFYQLEKRSKNIDLIKELQNEENIDKHVVIKGASGQWMEVRLVGCRLPEKIYNERIRKANKSAKSKGKILSQDEKERLKWILLITNIEEDILSTEAICELYRIRWQIELIFKCWKTYFTIDKMNNVGKDYLDCIILGKIIVITLIMKIYSILFFQVYKASGRLLSLMRFTKNILEELDIIIKYFTEPSCSFMIETLFDRVINSSLIEKRNRKTTEQSVANFDLPEQVLIMLR